MGRGGGGRQAGKFATYLAFSSMEMSQLGPYKLFRLVHLYIFWISFDLRRGRITLDGGAGI